MRKKKNNIEYMLFAALLFLVMVPCKSMAGDMNPPWEAKEESHIIRESKKRVEKKKREKHYETNTAKIPFLWGLKFYQKVISPVDGDKCGMYPTCSDYSYRAIRKHGAIIGLMMTVDRLLHEGSEQEHAPLIEKFGVIRYYDPVHNNDFWFAKEDDPA